MEKTTCFKLCYILGVSQEELAEAYPVEYRVAFELGAFNVTPAMQRFRELSTFYYQNLRNYEAGSLVKLQAAVEEHNILLGQVHADLQIQLSFALFELIAKCPNLDAKTAVQIAFIMSKTNPLYGLYFYQRELLNIALGAMLHDDLSLRDRLSLVSGERPQTLDQSDFGAAVRNYIGGVFISCPSDLGRPVFRYNGKTSGANYVTWVENNPEVAELSELSDGQTVVTQDARWVFKQAPSHTGVNFVVILPIDARHYRVWRRRILPNVYFLSIYK